MADGLDAYPVYSSPAVADDTVFINGGDQFLALDQGTGAIRWSRFFGERHMSSPAYADGIVYLGDGGYEGGGYFYGVVCAFDATTGETLWYSDPMNDWVIGSVAIANGVVYATSEDGHLVAIDAATGSQYTRLWIGRAANGSPAVSDGRVCVGFRLGTRAYTVPAPTPRIP